ncbi:MAG: aminotransferase class I/II-fold pyridoxal phosphate-dependent enzyme [Vampirovibrionales bacterium]|nr:aminotransferase class I/II-fold pyridoxal phosphate-dependent enzyme [Vampirovibrionales bacterium]
MTQVPPHQNVGGSGTSSEPLFKATAAFNSPTPKKIPVRIPLSVPCLGLEEEQSVMDCVKSGWVSSISPVVKAFENAFAQKLLVPYAIATNTGTSALHLAMSALGIGPGDEVIVPALTFIATVNPVRYLGATPVFVDVESTTFGMNPLAVEAAITEKTRAIVVAHLYGFPARIRAIKQIADKHGLPVIEDAAEALGAAVDGDFIGTIGTIGCFSFNGNKTITCGGGGMIVTKDERLAARMQHLSSQARVIDPECSAEITHDEVGYNCRMTGLQAAVGIAQLGKMDQFLAKKRKIARTYAQTLSLVPGIQTKYLAEPLVETEPSYWLAVSLLDEPMMRNKIIARALEKGIEFRPFFKPLPMLKPYQPFAKHRYPVAEALWQRGLCMPSCQSMSELQQLEVIHLLSSELTAFNHDRKKAADFAISDKRTAYSHVHKRL